MKPHALLPVALLFAACAGDNHVTRQSPREPALSAQVSASDEVRQPVKRPGQFAANRIYLITRLQTADEPHGEWRASGDTIRQNGQDIEFTELGSGKTVSFTGPHQITPTDARSDRSVVQFTNEEPNRHSDAFR
jgi:hypothetical protein